MPREGPFSKQKIAFYRSYVWRLMHVKVTALETEFGSRLLKKCSLNGLGYDLVRKKSLF